MSTISKLGRDNQNAAMGTALIVSFSGGGNEVGSVKGNQASPLVFRAGRLLLIIDRPGPTFVSTHNVNAELTAGHGDAWSQVFVEVVSHGHGGTKMGSSRAIRSGVHASFSAIRRRTSSG